MVCENCGKEIYMQDFCNYCGYNPKIDKNNSWNIVNDVDVKLPETKIVVPKTPNKFAKAGFILGFFSLFWVCWILSFIFCIVGLYRVKYCRSGKMLAILGLMECAAVIILLIAGISSLL